MEKGVWRVSLKKSNNWELIPLREVFIGFFSLEKTGSIHGVELQIVLCSVLWLSSSVYLEISFIDKLTLVQVNLSRKPQHVIDGADEPCRLRLPLSASHQWNRQNSALSVSISCDMKHKRK